MGTMLLVQCFLTKKPIRRGKGKEHRQRRRTLARGGPLCIHPFPHLLKCHSSLQRKLLARGIRSLRCPSCFCVHNRVCCVTEATGGRTPRGRAGPQRADLHRPSLAGLTARGYQSFILLAKTLLCTQKSHENTSSALSHHSSLKTCVQGIC